MINIKYKISMDKEGFMVKWFDESIQTLQKEYNKVILITDRYHVYFACRDIMLTGFGFNKMIVASNMKYFLVDNVPRCYNNLQFIGYLPLSLRDKYKPNARMINIWEYHYYQRYPQQLEKDNI